MRKLLFNLHLYVALGVGILVVIFGLTGAIMAFEPEIDHLLHAKLSYVTPQSHPLSLAEIGAAVSKAYPGERIGGYQLSTSPNLSWQVGLRRGLVYVNPYTGEILGVREGGRDFLGFVHQFHLRLALRDKADVGKSIMSWAGMVMLFLLFSGLYLWWPLKRISIQRNGPPRRFWFDLHNAVGILSLVFLLLLTFTGLLIGFDRNVVPWFYKITNSEPSKQPTVPPPPPGAKPISPDQALEIARNTLPGAIQFQVNVPGPKGFYFVRSRFPEDLTPGGRSRVAVDQYTGQVLASESSRTGPGGTRLVNLTRAIHTGDIFGMPSKALMSFVSLMLVIQVTSGVTMWWKRVRKKRAV
ncbi:MAG TPA: PepSY-associated TM helix domain-containing protein [Bryobacteraceae bacterium]|nr:PepSY-associated TM helix domain-containing protein [Bryobacteraceae bacterium]